MLLVASNKKHIRNINQVPGWSQSKDKIDCRQTDIYSIYLESLFRWQRWLSSQTHSFEGFCLCVCLCVFLVFWSKKKKQKEEHQNIKAHENYAQIWRSYYALVFRSVELTHRHSLEKIQWLKPVVMVTNLLRKFTSQYLRKKKTVLYPLLWYENTSHLRGEYTGDLDTQSP